jgi:anhydro-N-acetylmuramic acid kinase
MLSSKNSLILGVMSGTSLDGIDIAACNFKRENNQWKFDIIDAITYNYTNNEIEILKNAFYLSGVDLVSLHHQYGTLLGKKIKLFCNTYGLNPSYIASHGHTIFHQPNHKHDFFNSESDTLINNGFTFQLGHGANIAAVTGIKTICDFRTSDVAYGGQGAPLVPIGDELLFGEYDYCLNLGGISNISFKDKGKIKAFDIGVCNIALNDLAQSYNLKFDKDGLIAQSGKIEERLLLLLKSTAENNHLQKHSLGFEWYIQFIKPILDLYECNVPNKLRTLCEFIAFQISAETQANKSIFITGGGAKNRFLISCIQQQSKSKLIIPNEQIIDFKEALIFAFLGLLRVNEEANCLSKVTGASKNAIGGSIYLP